MAIQDKAVPEGWRRDGWVLVTREEKDGQQWTRHFRFPAEPDWGQLMGLWHRLYGKKELQELLVPSGPTGESLSRIYDFEEA